MHMNIHDTKDTDTDTDTDTAATHTGTALVCPAPLLALLLVALLLMALLLPCSCFALLCCPHQAHLRAPLAPFRLISHTTLLSSPYEPREMKKKQIELISEPLVDHTDRPVWLMCTIVHTVTLPYVPRVGQGRVS